MNKDALLATLIGFGIGLVITGIIILGPNLVKSFPKITFPKITLPQSKIKPQTASPTVAPAKTDLTIDSPLVDAIETNREILVSGSTIPQSIVVVAGLVDEDVAVVKEDGKYAGKITLVEGKNEILVTNYLGSNTLTKSVVIFYIQD